MVSGEGKLQNTKKMITNLDKVGNKDVSVSTFY